MSIRIRIGNEIEIDLVMVGSYVSRFQMYMSTCPLWLALGCARDPVSPLAFTLDSRVCLCHSHLKRAAFPTYYSPSMAMDEAGVAAAEDISASTWPA